MASIEEAKMIIKDTPISSVIGFYYPISKRGADFKGVCPFHKDTKPSMSVSDSKGVYKCFACGAAGDSIKFVQDYKNLDFIEAVKDIASQLSIPIDEFQKKEKNPKFEMGFRVLNGANRLYKKVANELKPEQFTNFLKERNLNNESVTNFGLGYAPSNNALTSYLNSIPNQKEKEFAIDLAKEMGIIRDSKHGPGQYDFFRDRVVFPIWDHSGQVRGFQARAVLPDQKPKYMNSRESFIFDKGNILYGFNIAKPNIRQKDSVIVVEGNMDVVVLHQFGFTNSVGTMGVAFSENSARLLTNMTKNFFLGMDSDDAGLKGMERINEMLLPLGILPKYLDFSPSKDPDEFLNEFGRLELIERMEKAPTFIDHKIGLTIPKPIPQTTDKKLEVLQSIFDILSPLGENLIAKEKAISAGQSLGLQSSKEDITDAYKKHLEQIKQKKSKFQKAKPVEQPHAPQPEPSDSMSKLSNQPVAVKKVIKKPTVGAPSKAELMLLDQLISNPECLEDKQITEILDLIVHSDVKQIVQWLKNIYLEIDDADYINFIKSRLELEMMPEIKNVIASALFNYEKVKLNKKIVEKLLNDFKTRLKTEVLKIEKKTLISSQKEALTQEESLEILKEIQKVERQLLELKKK